MYASIRLKTITTLTILLFGIGILASPAFAQYFGRNKVQYEKFDFKVMKTKHFDIYFYPEMRKAAEQAARMAERWYSRFSRILNHKLKGRQPLILYASSPHFQQTTALSGEIGEGTGGVTEIFKRRIILPVGASLAETDHIIGHELVHAFQFSLTSQGHPGYGGGGSAAMRLPLWFIEGLAEYLSIGTEDSHTAMWMRDATFRKEVPEIKKLDSYRYFPYRYGQSLWAYMTGRWGDSTISQLMNAVSRGGNYEAAVKRVLRIEVDQLSKDWLKSMKDNYDPLREMTDVVDPDSSLLFKGTEENMLNVSPALSPDGKQIVFLSTRDLFSIDLYLADAASGKISRKLVTTAVDPYFDSLQFIKSAGSWDAEGKRFVFGAIRKGQPMLAISNVDTGEKEKEIVFEEIGEILNPTWSPDGRYIAFSALQGGFTDIFLYDLQTEQLKKMTDDPYGDLYPTWAPDGSMIAFSTERFSTDLSILSIGNYDLALLDPRTGEIKKIPGFIGSKHINPQWSVDSKSLYFLSNQSGISNVYRIDLSTKKISQLTNLYTGVTGITELSPALAVAQKTGKVSYCAYEEGKFSIYSIDPEKAAADHEPKTKLGKVKPSVLPPREKPEGEVLGLLKNPLYGLPEDSEYTVSNYKPKMVLDYVSPPQMAMGVDRFGTYGGGGIAMFFSDMLGYHSLFSMAQVSSRLIDSAALVGYQNASSRFNWGAVLQRIPYVTGYYNQYYGNVYGEPAIIEEEYLIRQINYELAGFASYPFHRSRRLELSAGYKLLDFDQEIRTNAYSLNNGQMILRDKEKLPAPDSIHFGFASAALVYDTAFFGATSPILGQSYRLEFKPLFGNITYFNVLSDYRRYFMPARPFTFAFRFLHYGRYGKDSEDRRLYPLYLGYETLIRGYNYNSFTAEEWTGGPDEEFIGDRLFGSKMMVANFELRFPLFQILGLGSGYYGAFPMDFLAFYDVGIAWYNSDKLWFLGGNKKPVSSVGVGLRTNLMGYLIIGLQYVHPFNRPERGSYFQFTLTPGF